MSAASAYLLGFACGVVGAILGFFAHDDFRAMREDQRERKAKLRRLEAEWREAQERYDEYRKQREGSAK